MTSAPTNPLVLIAELTHRCPLHCVYCSNPLELTKRAEELPTEVWTRVFGEAAEAGVMQVDFTGGEPLVRTDIVRLVQAARTAGLYVSLITSGLPLDEEKLDTLVLAGLDHLQLSFQGATALTAREISGTTSHAQKLRVLHWLASRKIGVTLNFVLQRSNLGELEEMLAIAESSTATRVEFAHVQYYGWAFANREKLLPARDEVLQSVEFFKQAQERLRNKIRIEYVVPDYHARFPKPCMGGWGRKAILLTPRGDALPCHAAAVIPGLRFANVKEFSIGEIWESSEAFQKFRGEDWMQEPCKSCDRREQDFGGCRCQAMLITGDASATDPVCSLAPTRNKVDAILLAVAAGPDAKPEFCYRPNPA
jgi:pyrroloquinoline quinone biosynthesis protein E